MVRQMKDSGVEWIGQIPENWEVRKLDSIAQSITDYVASGSFASLSENVQYLDEPDYAMLIRTVDLSKGDNKKPVYINKHAYDFLKNSNLFGGEIILSNIGSVGNVYMYEPMYERASLAPNAIMVNMKESNRYYYYWFLNPLVNDTLKQIGSNAVQCKFNKTQLRAFLVAHPNGKEQQKIADFLDEKVAEIDSAIEKTKATIEDYKKYKQSIITETVTKGLNSDVEMKDTNSTWIGKIPRHWRYIRIQNLFEVVNERNTNPDACLLSLYTSIGVKPRNELEEKGNKAITVMNYKIVKRNDIIVNKLLAWMGAIAYSNYNGVTSPDYDIYRAKEGANVLKDYYNLYFRYTCFKDDCYKYGRGIMLMRWRTYPEEFLRIKVPNPPLKEQKEIALYLDKKCSEIDKLITKKEELIKELENYKKSLIYECVTGKREV